MKASIVPPALLLAVLATAARPGAPAPATGAPGEETSAVGDEVSKLREENARLRAAHDDLVVKYNRLIQDNLRLSRQIPPPRERKALAHHVFFTLKDRSPAARQKLVAACVKDLPSLPGIISFSCGTPVEGEAAPNEDRDYDVALGVLFEDRAALERYRKDPAHAKLVEENGAGWEKVRVFDGDVRVTLKYR